MSRDEEVELHARVVAGDEAARSEFVRRNQGLVYSIARRYCGRGLDYEELAQEGNLGLLRAVELFDVAQGNKFSTYATHWIKSKIRRAIREKAKLVQVPSHLYDRVAQWKRAGLELEARLGREPTTAELERETGFRADRITPAISALRGASSLDASRSLRSGDEGSWIDTFSADDEPAEEASDRRGEVARLLATLPERDRVVLELRFGLTGHQHKLDEVGEKLGLSRERIRQLELRALASLSKTVGSPAPMSVKQALRKGPRRYVPRSTGVAARFQVRDELVAPRVVAGDPKQPRRKTMVSAATPAPSTPTNGVAHRDVKPANVTTACAVEGCSTTSVLARGLCCLHYNRANMAVRRKQGTWAELESDGWKSIEVTPPRKAPRKAPPHSVAPRRQDPTVRSTIKSKSSPPPSSAESRPSSVATHTPPAVAIRCAACGQEAMKRPGSRFCSPQCRWRHRDKPTAAKPKTAPKTVTALVAPLESAGTDALALQSLGACVKLFLPLSPETRRSVFAALAECFGGGA